jgi:hypothetical protein
MTAPQRETSEPLSEQGLIVYRALHEQIGFLKKQQWTITNYLLLIYAAVFGIMKELSTTDTRPALRCMAIGAVGLTCLYGLAALVKVQYDLGETRKSISCTDQRIFGTTERDLLGIRRDKDPYGRGLFFTSGLALTLVFGAVFVISYLVCKQ